MTTLEEMLEADVLTLGMAADEARRSRADGGVVTYLRVQTVTAAELASGAPVPDAATEVRLYEVPGTLEEAVAHVRALRERAGARRVAAFSMADLAERPWGPLDVVLRALVDAGLDDVAELPADAVPDLPAMLAALKRAGVRPRRITVAAPLADRRLRVLERVRAAVAAHPDVMRFAPLPRRAPVDRPTTGYEDVRMVALSRLALGVLSIEVDWTLYGPKLAQVALTFGADHLDAVPAADDLSLGPRRGPVQDVERNIAAAGFRAEEFRATA